MVKHDYAGRSTIRVALIYPSIADHKYRGTGVYARGLFSALSKLKNVKISLLQISDNFREYDVIHYPYFDPFFLTLPLLKMRPTVVTVHDVIPIKFWKYYHPGMRGTIKWFVQKFSLSLSSGILTDSYASKRDIEQYIGVPSNKIHVTYLGVDKIFRVIEKDNILNKTQIKLSLPDEFILHVGDVNYNKNIQTLIKSFSLVIKRYPSIHLVLLGKGFQTPSRQLDEISEIVRSLRLEEKVIRIGYIDIQDLIAVYNLAKVYVQPSYAEGFCLPVLEAMSCGCPVVASSSSSITEIVGEASLLVDPNDYKNIANSILQLISDRMMRSVCVKKGLNRAEQFSWEKCAQETFKIYNSIINQMNNQNR